MILSGRQKSAEDKKEAKALLDSIILDENAYHTMLSTLMILGVNQISLAYLSGREHSDIIHPAARLESQPLDRLLVFAHFNAP